MKISTPNQFLEHMIQDLYSAETQIVEALPKMVESATSSKLSAGFKQHLEETKAHVARLEEVADILDLKLGNIKCKGMEGLLSEGDEAIKNIEDKQLLDIALISGARKVEHYEILGYKLLIMLLKDDKEAADIIKMTLDEEEITDKKLNDMITE